VKKKVFYSTFQITISKVGKDKTLTQIIQRESSESYIKIKLRNKTLTNISVSIFLIENEYDECTEINNMCAVSCRRTHTLNKQTL
jgi:hypothetical protein